MRRFKIILRLSTAQIRGTTREPTHFPICDHQIQAKTSRIARVAVTCLYQCFARSRQKDHRGHLEHPKQRFTPGSDPRSDAQQELEYAESLSRKPRRQLIMPSFMQLAGTALRHLRFSEHAGETSSSRTFASTVITANSGSLSADFTMPGE